MNITLITGIIFFALAQFSYAGDFITIDNSWVREVPPGSSVSAVYMTINNNGEDDRLVAISSDISENAELHTSMVNENDVASMEMMKVLDIPSGETVELKPGGMHIMLIGLKESLVDKKSVNLELTFEKAGLIDIEIPVKRSNYETHIHNH